MLNKIYDLFEKSVIISGLVALALTVTACWMWVSGRSVPDQLAVMLGIVVTFFFSQRQQNATTQQMKAVIENAKAKDC
jgi:hypothetical protein